MVSSVHALGTRSRLTKSVGLAVFLIRTTSFPILLGIHFSQRWKLHKGLELKGDTAGAVLAWLPSSISGKTGSLDVIQAVFITGHDSSNQRRELWEREALAQVKECAGDGDSDAHRRLSRNLMENPVPSSPVPNDTVDTANTMGSTSAPTHDDRRGSDGGYIRGLGHLSSPLARLFGADAPRSSNSPPATKPTVDGADTKMLLAKVEKLEEQNQRLERLMQRLLQQLEK